MRAQITSNGPEPAAAVGLISSNGTLLSGQSAIGHALRGAEQQEAVKFAPGASGIFEIESAAANLEQLQERPRMLLLAGAGQALPENQVDLRGMKLQVTFRDVRGSISTREPANLGFGGNTAG